eukprot:scaffold139386_cov527-Phaeocystis_antarctica.AAC.1
MAQTQRAAAGLGVRQHGRAPTGWLTQHPQKARPQQSRSSSRHLRPRRPAALARARHRRHRRGGRARQPANPVVFLSSPHRRRASRRVVEMQPLVQILHLLSACGPHACLPRLALLDVSACRSNSEPNARRVCRTGCLLSAPVKALPDRAHTVQARTPSVVRPL